MTPIEKKAKVAATKAAIRKAEGMDKQIADNNSVNAGELPICRNCGVTVPLEEQVKGSLSREGKWTCAACLGEQDKARETVGEMIASSGGSLKPAEAAILKSEPVGKAVMEGVSSLEAALARNTKAAPAPAPAPAPAVVMVKLEDQLTEAEEKKVKTTVPSPTPVVGDQGVQPMPAEGSTMGTEQRKLEARAWIIEQVTKAAADLTDKAFHAEVLEQLSRVTPPVMSEEKRAARLEQLAAARRVWQERSAAKSKK